MARKLTAAAAVLLIAAAVVLLATRRVDRDGERVRPVAGGEVAVAYPEEPPSLGPYIQGGRANSTGDLLRPVLPTLLTIGPDLEYRPGLAIRVPSGEDLSEQPFAVTFHLDPEAVWSDGAPITAEDVRFTWEVVRDPNLAIAERSGYERLLDVEVAGPQTLRLVFDAPYAAWRDLFSAGDFILPRHALEGRDLAGALSEGLSLSGGPFEIESVTPGLEITYRRNPRWWREGPYLDRVRVFVVPDIQTALQLLGEDRVQVVVGTTQINLERRMVRLEGVRALAEFGSAWWELAFNHERAGVREAPFRRAVAHGWDRAGFLEAVVRGEGRALQHLLPGRPAGDAFGRYGHDRALSRRLLAEGGFREGGRGTFSIGGAATFRLAAPSESEIAGVIQRSMQRGLNDAGIDVEIGNPRGVIFYGEFRRDGDFDLALWERRGTGSFSPLGFYHSAWLPPAGSNYYRLSSAQIDSILESIQSRAAYDRAELQELTAHLAEFLPAVPLFEAKAYAGFREHLVGVAPNASVDGPLWNMHEWWLSTPGL